MVVSTPLPGEARRELGWAVALAAIAMFFQAITGTLLLLFGLGSGNPLRPPRHPDLPRPGNEGAGGGEGSLLPRLRRPAPAAYRFCSHCGIRLA